MYGWFWGHLPGPTAVRVRHRAAALRRGGRRPLPLGLPLGEPRLPFTDVTVDESAARSGRVRWTP